MVAAPGLGGPTEKVWVAKGKKPQLHDDRAIEKLMAMVTALTGEVAMLRDRLDTHERLAEEGKPSRRQDVDAYIPDTGVMAERSTQHQRLLRKVFRVLKEDLARHETPADDAELDRLAKEINAA